MAEAAEASPAVAGGDEDSDDDEAERMVRGWARMDGFLELAVCCCLKRGQL